MEKIRRYAQSLPITFESWLISFVGIVLIRIFFEQFSSFDIREPFILIDAPTLVHYSLLYLVEILGLMIIILLFTKIKIKEAFTVSILGLFVLWVAPIIDLMAGGVGGHIMSYLFVPGKELLLRFLTFFGGPINSGGITIGMKIEIIIGLIFGYFYVYTIKKNIYRAIGATIAFYCFVFFLLSLPSFMALFLAQTAGPFTLIVHSIISSHIIQNNLHPFFTGTDLGLIELAFNKVMIGVWTILALITSMSLFFIGARTKFIAIIKNSRLDKIIHFCLLFTLGAVLTHATLFTNWIDVQSYILALIAFTCAWMFSVCQNDIQDKQIDSISNKDRPMITKDLDTSDMQNASKIFLLFALLSAYASSSYVLFFVCLFIFIYYIYSNPPLRLKQFVVLSSFLISLAALSAVLAGFFLISTDKTITAFPFSLVMVIIILFTAVTNIRDIKDIDGDRADGIQTIPVLLGLKKSKKIIAGVITFFFLLAPWYFHTSFLVIPSILASVLAFYFITKEKYEEWEFYIVYGAYLVLIIGAIFFKW